MILPPTLAASPLAARLAAALYAIRGAGAGLLALRGSIAGTEGPGGQLKTSIDLAAEGWVLGFLEGEFPGGTFLAEERFDRAGAPWPGATDYWTVDALDGTRSFVDGFPGFCVQVGYVSAGTPVLGAIYEPTADTLDAAARGAGAFLHRDGTWSPLSASTLTSLSPGLRFVDSTRPTGALATALSAYQFVECGSVGLKLCRVLSNDADLYAKPFHPKLWDVAPGEAIARELGITVLSWSGAPFDYAGTRTHYDGVLAGRAPLLDELMQQLE